MGGILRILVIGLVVWGVYSLVRRHLSGTVLNRDARSEVPPPGQADAMRKCSYCNVHIPEGESTRSRGHYFCSEAHRDAFLQRQG